MTSADSISLILRRLDEIERKLDRIMEELMAPTAIGYSVRRGNRPGRTEATGLDQRSEQTTLENGLNMKDRLGWLLMAPFIIGPIVELGLRLRRWHMASECLLGIPSIGYGLAVGMVGGKVRTVAWRRKSKCAAILTSAS
jgi:hypothetical protein